MKNRIKTVWAILGISFVGVTAATILSDEAISSQEGTPESAAPAHATEIPVAPGGHETARPADAAGSACITSPVAVEDLNQQREKLQAREKELAAKEAELKALEQAVNEEFKKLDQARSDIAKIEGLKKKENQEKVAKIVETLETMSPKPASALLSSLDEPLAVTAMEQMSTQKLAKIMNIMEAGRSSRLTELLAGVVRARGATLAAVSVGRLSPSNDGAATAKSSVKGGEENDGQNKQQSSGRTERPQQRQPDSSQKAKGTR